MKKEIKHKTESDENYLLKIEPDKEDNDNSGIEIDEDCFKEDDTEEET